MTRRLAGFLLIATLTAQATGLVLDVHLHACAGDHEADHCPTCQFLHVGASATVQEPPMVFSGVGGETLHWSAARPYLEQFARSPVAPRAPPGA